MPNHQLDRVDAARRKARIVELRRDAKHWDEIGREFDISPQRAHAIWKEALAEAPNQQVHEHRAEQGQMIERATASLLAIATDDREYETEKGLRYAVSPRTRVEAWSAIRGWMERHARTYGTDAPTKSQVDVVNYDGFTAQLERLRAELGESTQQAIEASADDVTDAELVEAVEARPPENDG